MELSQKPKQPMEEAAKDTAWVEKLRAAATWEEYEKLLNEKGIEAPTKLRELFEASRTSKTGALTDDQLEQVSGGWDYGFLPCNQEYNDLLCRWTGCPHMKDTGEDTGGASIRYYCDWFHWKKDIAVVGGY